MISPMWLIGVSRLESFQLENPIEMDQLKLQKMDIKLKAVFREAQVSGKRTHTQKKKKQKLVLKFWIKIQQPQEPIKGETAVTPLEIFWDKYLKRPKRIKFYLNYAKTEMDRVSFHSPLKWVYDSTSKSIKCLHKFDKKTQIH